MLREPPSFLTRILTSVGILKNFEPLALPPIEEEQALLSPQLESVKVDLDDEPSVVWDDFALIAPISKATKLFNTTKEIHQKLIAGKQETLDELRKQKKINLGLFIFLLTAGVSGIALTIALMVMRFNQLMQMESGRIKAEQDKIKADHEPELHRIQNLLDQQAEVVLANYNSSEHARLREGFFGPYMHYVTRLYDFNFYEVIFDLAELHAIKWNNLDTTDFRYSLLPGKHTCWTSSGDYVYKGRPHEIAFKYIDDCENGIYSFPMHPRAICYDILKNICDFWSISPLWTGYEWVEHSPRATKIENEYRQALRLKEQLMGQEDFIANLLASVVVLTQPEAWILGTTGVVIVLGLLSMMIYMMCSYSNVSEEYKSDTARTDRYPIRDYLDDETEQKFQRVESVLPYKLDDPANTSTIKKIQQTARLLFQQRYGQYLLFKCTRFGDLMTDMKGEVTAHFDDKLDTYRDMPNSVWMSKK